MMQPMRVLRAGGFALGGLTAGMVAMGQEMDVAEAPVVMAPFVVTESRLGRSPADLLPGIWRGSKTVIYTTAEVYFNFRTDGTGEMGGCFRFGAKRSQAYMVYRWRLIGKQLEILPMAVGGQIRLGKTRQWQIIRLTERELVLPLSGPKHFAWRLARAEHMPADCVAALKPLRERFELLSGIAANGPR